MLTRCLDVEGRLQGRLRPSQAGRCHGRAAEHRGPVPGALPDTAPSRRGAARGGAPRGIGDRQPRAARDADERRAACRPARPGRAAASRPRTRDRSSRPRARRRARLLLDGGDVRAGPHRSQSTPRRAAEDGRRRRVVPSARRALRPDRDDEAAVRRLLDPVAIDDVADSHRRARSDRGARVPPARPRTARPIRARCDSSASASRA